MRKAVACALLVALPTLARESGLGYNLGFEAWSPELRRPEGWMAGPAATGAVFHDCEEAPEGRCALRIERSVAGGALPSLGQAIAAGRIGGHPVRLTGSIRTRDVQGGWAALWMRVDGPGGEVVALQNMDATGPRGTTEWQRFEVVLPVAANARQLVFGVFLSGTGSAWFDDLRLEIDKMRTVPDLILAEPPPRPEFEPALLPQEELDLPRSEMVAVAPASMEDARQRAKPIRSLFSEDFADLQFLKPLLEGKRVVQLGESGHGVAEFNWMKVRLVKFLHREMGFDVIAFESSLTACDAADARVGRAPPVEVMRDCIFPVWHTSETFGLFEYLDAVRRSGKPLALAGFDVQDSGAAARDTTARFERLLRAAGSPLAERIAAEEKRVRGKLSREDEASLLATYGEVLETLTRHRDRLREARSERPIEVDLAIQEARSRSVFVRQLAAHDNPMLRTRIRDQGMADNLDFLLDRVHPGRKVIVWAHNAHIAKSRLGQVQPQAMGGWVAERRKAEVYTIGLYMGRGVAARNDRQRYEIKPPPADSLEAIMASAGWRMSFVDLSTPARGAGAAWMASPLVAREWGVAPNRLVPAESYDGVLYIHTVTPPQYK